jgi:hypothetical protein
MQSSEGVQAVVSRCYLCYCVPVPYNPVQYVTFYGEKPFADWQRFDTRIPILGIQILFRIRNSALTDREPDPYYLSKIQRNFRKKVQYG